MDSQDKEQLRHSILMKEHLLVDKTWNKEIHIEVLSVSKESFMYPQIDSEKSRRVSKEEKVETVRHMTTACQEIKGNSKEQ